MLAAQLLFVIAWLSASPLPGPHHPLNEELTDRDLRWLAPDEDQIFSALPAFFRIQVRRANPHIPESGRVRYPRVSANVYELRHGHRETHLKSTTGVGAGESKVSGPEDAREVALAINPVTSTTLVAGANGEFGLAMFASYDGAQSWLRVQDLPLGSTCCDPAVEWSTNGRYVYAIGLGGCTPGGCNVWAYRSDNRGLSWDGLNNVSPGDPRRELSLGAVSDKPFLHVDHGAQSAFADRIYVAWHQGFELRLSYSLNGAATFSPARSFPGEPPGLGVDITSGPGGQLYLFWPTLGKEIRMVRSNDGGESFAASVRVSETMAQVSFPLPAAESRGAFIYAVADVDHSTGPYRGRVHVAWTDTKSEPRTQPVLNHALVRAAHSDDGGESWTVVNPHALDDTDAVDRWHPWLRVDGRGWVHLVYYDSRHAAGREGVDLYYQISIDGGQSYSPPRRLSSETSGNLPDATEFGDYNALDIRNAMVVAGFTDSRRESTVVGPSPDVYSIRGEGALGDRLFVGDFEAMP